jgi:DNA-binding NarL/FixJ family response regulator
MEYRKRKDLSQEEVEEIYQDIAKGESNESIAEKFHISEVSVWAYRAWNNPARDHLRRSKPSGG